MDMSKLDPQWVLAQGIAVFVCVILCCLLSTMVALLLRVIIRELRLLQKAQETMATSHVEAIGKLIGAIRWLGELVRSKLGVLPPENPEEGFQRRKTDFKSPAAPLAPGARRVTSTPTPTPKPINPNDLDKSSPLDFGE